MQYRNIFGQVNTALRECKATKEKNAIRAVADELGVSYDTVGNWKRSPKFKAYYRRLRREAYDEALAVLQAASLAAAAKIARATEWDDPDNIKVEVADGIVKAGRPDLALAAARMVMDLSAKWVDGVDVPERLEKLERKAKKAARE